MVIHHEDADLQRVECDVVLIGGGIMSATLGVMLKELEPDLKIEIFERLDRVAAESSDAWNNAGTGHSALCELNYTPETEDGGVDIAKALKIVESFEVSKQFWAYLMGHGYFDSPNMFVNQIPHLSVVFGAENVAFLRKRYEAMQACHLFSDMEYTEDWAKLQAWMPLIMEGRDPNEPLAATKMEMGTDVNFGALTRSLFQHLKGSHDVEVFLNHHVYELDPSEDKTLWDVFVKDTTTGKKRVVRSKFVFIGAGGGSLPLLEKSEITESYGFGGFPVSGQWLICNNPDVIARHDAKVYGKASVGAPPMSVPHLDTRIIDGKKALLFGPYAGFTTKFLKEGSVFDLPLSIHIDNIRSMLGAFVHNLPLTKYLIEQVSQGEKDRIEVLREFVPNAVAEDWELAHAGQRVQVIRKDSEEGGILEFGTVVVTSKNGTIAALLGASPGASTAVTVMIELLYRCFPEQMNSPAWYNKLKAMIPSFGEKLLHNPVLTKEVRAWTKEVLELK